MPVIPLAQRFQCAGAAIPGTDHTMPGKPAWKNCQDAFFLRAEGEVIVGLVTDGCGSSEHSELGAQLGAQIFGQKLFALAQRSIAFDQPTFTRWHEVRMHTLSVLQNLASQLGESLSTVLGQFLFSTVGFLVMPQNTYVFRCGDGIFAVNEEVTKLGPFDMNAPPYLTYALLDESLDRSKLVISEYQTSDIQSLCVGTDGTDYVPELCLTINALLREDAVFRNPDVLRRRLAVMNMERVKDGCLVGGPLRDDTGLVLLRRIPEV